MSTRSILSGLSALVIVLTVGLAPVSARTETIDPEIKERAWSASDRGLAFLRQSQEENGSWLGSVGITALALRAFVTSPKGHDAANDDAISAAVAFIVSQAQPDGSITESIQNRNYNTATAMTALLALDDPEHAAVIESARKFLFDLQLAEHSDYPPEHPFFGGIGYGGDERPDLSNMYYAMEALDAAGVADDDPVIQRAMVFITRSQNNSETNDQPWAGNDGGFTYMPGPSSHADTVSYGGMTHAGLISLIFAGADKSDPRIQSAYEWIRNNYTVETNPGSTDDQGLYFYYSAFAKSMSAYGETIVVDADGVSHNWRNDLAAKLVSLQGEDGAWINPSPRWWEGLKPLVTARSVIALNIAAE